MSWICEIAISGDAERHRSLAAWLAETARPRLAQLAGLGSLDVYMPDDVGSQDPYNRDEAAPRMLVLAEFAGAGALQEAMSGGMLREVLGALPEGLHVTASALRRSFHAPDENGCLPGNASYVVRYLRPAEDDELFVRAYLDSHPSIEARLPGIRSVICYLPLRDMSVPGYPSMDYLVGNEVVFDSADAFNAAMRSPAREELRAHFHELPPFSGGSTHFLMRRTRLVAGSPAIMS